MKKLIVSLSIAFVLLTSAAIGAEVNQYVVGVKGMT